MVVEVWIFLLLVRCRIEACNGMQEIVINKVSIIGIDLDFLSCYSMKKNFGHSEDMRNMVYGRFVHFKGGSTL